MILIILTLCSQPVGFILEDANKVTIYSEPAIQTVLPELIPKIEKHSVLPLDILNPDRKCA